MNCIQSFIDHALKTPHLPAIWDVSNGVTTFSQVYRYAAQVQTLACSSGAEKGDYVLVFGKIEPSLYAAVIGLLGLGCSPIFIEPWMALSEIEEIIAETQPKIYITNFLGRLWGMRSKAIRKIPVWISQHRIKDENSSRDLIAIPLSEDHVGFLTFTTGTTGRSKGVVRTHGVLFHQRKVLSHYLSAQGKIDLTVLPNFVLLNLSMGKTSCLIPSNSSRRVFQSIPDALKPSSVSCGPGFLQKLMENRDCFPDLTSFHIGGALAECALYEKGFAMWPNAQWIQVYGSSEAEPVAICDAKEVVKKCRSRSYHQTLYLGTPISELETCFDQGILWVSGDHVSPFYYGNHEANQTQKKIDAAGRLWHNMGDRILADSEGWWYQGRSSQPLSDFTLEQQISAFLNTNDVLIVNHKYLLGAGVEKHREALLHQFPVLNDVIECKVYRDRRHQARIDREKTIDLLRNSGFVYFWNYFGRFSLFFRGIISTFVYYPPKKKRKLTQKNPKIDRT